MSLSSSNAEGGRESDKQTADGELVSRFVDTALAPDRDAVKELRSLFDAPSMEGPNPIDSERLSTILGADFKLTDREFVGYPVGLEVDSLHALRDEWSSGMPLELRHIVILLQVLKDAPGKELSGRIHEKLKETAVEVFARGDGKTADRAVALIEDSEAVEAAPVLVAMLEVLGDDELDKEAPELPIVLRALQSPAPEPKRRALKIGGSFWDDTDKISDILLPLLDAQEQKIRRRAYMRLATHHPTLLEQKVELLLERGDFESTSLGELQFLFDLFAELRQERGGELRKIVTSSRGWFNAASRKSIRAAARVLLERGDRAGIAAIEARSESLLTAPKLRKSLRALLELHGHENG